MKHYPHIYALTSIFWLEHIRGMQDAFSVLAEPARRNILNQLRAHERTVGELVDSLGMAQPSVSKHLRVLREAGFVTSRTVAQQRIYRIEFDRMRAIDDWLAPYRRMWTRHLGALERHLDNMGGE
jgi:DNA-binding transcriptional ArsR family regulator